MIRNAVIHVNNEQPLLADLFELPKPSDVGLVCTNLRTMDGRRPVFIDRIEGTFFFPYLHIRFVEIPPGATGMPELGPGEVPDAVPVAPGPGTSGANGNDGANGTGPGAPTTVEDDGDLELDEDFLRRIREV